MIFRYPTFGNSTERLRTYNGKADISYITGSHAVKVGSQWQWGSSFNNRAWPNTELQLLRGVPVSVSVNTLPYDTVQSLKISGGVYAQDQWTIGRMTANVGLRLDYVNAYVPEQHIPPVEFVGARDFAAVRNVPNWKDLTPRLGAAWDVFGDGRTAVKVSLNKYLSSMATGIAAAVNPVVTSVNSTTRAWNDINGDFIPQPNELGPFASASFGQTRITTRFDPDLLEGWGKRPYSWEGSAGIQHQFRPGLAVNLAYFRNAYANFTVNDNLAVSPGDYNQYCITTPADPRLPTASQQLCGFYDINPLKFGQVNNLVTGAKNYGDMSEVYNGVDLTVTLRLARDAIVQGGLNVGRMAFDNCDVVAKVDQRGGTIAPITVINFDQNWSTLPSPSTNYCHITQPFLTQVKLLVVYPLPWDMQLSATLQSLHGPEITASYVATTAEISPSLGRDLAGGVRTATVELISPGTQYGERLNQLDIRVAKNLRVGRKRLQGQIDLYNSLNTAVALTQINTYGPKWLTPIAILPGRLVRFGVQVEF